MSIAEFSPATAKPYFRSGEARVIARLLESGPQVLATGGGAFMNADTRALIKAKGISIWLNAEFDVLLRRIGKRRNDRPLLQTADPAETLRRLLAEREPTYALADLTVQSREVAHDAIVADILTALAAFLKAPRRRSERPAHDRAASLRSHNRQGRARRPQLRHRHRTRPDRFARRAHRGAAPGREGRHRHRRECRASSPRRRRSRARRGRRGGEPASSFRPARARRAFASSSRSARRSSPRASSAAIW